MEAGGRATGAVVETLRDRVYFYHSVGRKQN